MAERLRLPQAVGGRETIQGALGLSRWAIPTAGYGANFVFTSPGFEERTRDCGQFGHSRMPGGSRRGRRLLCLRRPGEAVVHGPRCQCGKAALFAVISAVRGHWRRKPGGHFSAVQANMLKPKVAAMAGASSAPRTVEVPEGGYEHHLVPRPLRRPPPKGAVNAPEKATRRCRGAVISSSRP
jgi:hypothetical protein